MALRGKDRGRFWLEFFGTWWEKYPWRLSDHTEPPSDDPEKMAELAFVGAEDLTAKANVEQQLDSVSFGGNFWFRRLPTLSCRGSGSGSNTDHPSTTLSGRAAIGLRFSDRSIDRLTPNPAVAPPLRSL